VLFLSTFLLSCWVHAETHFDDVQVWRRAKVIASGRQVFSLQSSYQDISNRFNADGRVEPLGRPYAQVLTWGQLAKSQGPARADVDSYMRDNDLHSGDVAATSTYQIDQQEIGFGLNWAYGMSRGWMIGAQVPVTYRTTRVHQDAELTPALTQGVGRPGSVSVLGKNRKDVQLHVRSLAGGQLADMGYDHVPAERRSWDFGDVNLISQLQLYESYRWVWSAQQTVRFPTAQSQRLGDYIQAADEDGPLALGASSLLDCQLRRMIIGLRIGYLAQLPDTARLRVPSTAGGSSQIDPVVKRDLGDWTWAATDAEVRLSPRVDFSVEYAYWTKGRDRYSGQAFDGADYQVLSENTEQQIHQTRLGFLFRLSTGVSRTEGKWVAALDYTYPWIGRNSADAARTSLALSNYF
jgi:hypothetical protein